jgi:inorganic triphosphatase YgiF
LKFGASEIQVALDQGKIDTGGMAAPICELELELKRGNAGDLFRLAQKLDGKVPLTLSYETKSGRGYALLEGLAPWVAKAEAVRMRPGVSCADAFRAIAHECLRQMIQNREGIAQGKSEALHQMRIAVRRFRSALTIFRDLVAGEGAEAVKAELRALRELTGPARDLDLFVNEVIAPLRAELPKDRELAAFERLARRERSRATRAARKAILSSPFRKFVMHAAAWVESGDWRTSADALTQARQDAPVEIYAAELLAPMHRKVRNHGQALRELDDERRHRLRVRAKKLRYAAEFFAGLASDKKTRKRARRMIESLRTLQDKLGALNDLAVYRNLATETGLAMTSEPQRSRNGHDAGAIADLIARRQSVRLEPLMQEAVEAFSEFRAAKPYWKWSRKRMIRSEKAERRPAEEAVSAPEAKKAA